MVVENWRGRDTGSSARGVTSSYWSTTRKNKQMMSPATSAYIFTLGDVGFSPVCTFKAMLVAAVDASAVDARECLCLGAKGTNEDPLGVGQHHRYLTEQFRDLHKNKK